MNTKEQRKRQQQHRDSAAKWLQSKGREYKGFCECCGKQLTLTGTVWLELNQMTGKYHWLGVVADDESQGCFPFGKSCAKKVAE